MPTTEHVDRPIGTYDKIVRWILVMESAFYGFECQKAAEQFFSALRSDKQYRDALRQWLDNIENSEILKGGTNAH